MVRMCTLEQMTHVNTVFTCNTEQVQVVLPKGRCEMGVGSQATFHSSGYRHLSDTTSWLWEKQLKTVSSYKTKTKTNFLILMSEGKSWTAQRHSEYKCALEFLDISASLCEAKERNWEDIQYLVLARWNHPER